MHYHPLKIIALCLYGSLLLSACSLLEKDNLPAPTPLTTIHPTLSPQLLWKVQIGTKGQANYPAITNTTIFTTDIKGTVTAIERSNGKIKWQKKITNASFATGPVTNEQLVIAASHTGQVFALDPITGSINWHKQITGSILAPPLLSHGKVIIKTLQGDIIALSNQQGQIIWTFHQDEPPFILQRASAPILLDHHLFIGFANGQLINLDITTGKLYWIKILSMPEGAFTIERMVDIDADPISFQQKLYVVNYQGYLQAMRLSGHVLWSHRLSSYTGMTIDLTTIYLSDAQSHLWAFNRANGAIRWHQAQLAARFITKPVDFGDNLVVGDAEGYLHWLCKQDGHFIARIQVSTSSLATPLIAGKTIYITSGDGYLSALYTQRISRGN